MRDSDQFVPTRRAMIAGGAIAGAGMLAPGVLLAQRGATVVETSNGRVRGLAADGVVQFRGIPYGGDTSGRHRFMPPTPATAWAGVRDCTQWGHVAPQGNNATPDAYGAMVGWNNYRGGMSEDCLVLNVWTPAPDAGRRAVMVVFHGGGYTSGSGNLVALEGQFMARAGNMVVVTVNHRLGALGYLDLSAIGGAAFASSGMVGMLDCVQALAWVRDNIGHFGGDPSRVAVSGQSGGGGKVSVLLAMPAAKGLIHRAAIQSGSTLDVATPEAARRNTEQLLARLGIGRGEIGRLQAMPFDQVVAAQAQSGPVVDGVTLPHQPFDPDAPAQSANVPMLIGTCLEDFGFGLRDKTDSEASLQAYAEEQAPGHAGDVLAAYRRLYPAKRPYLIKAMISTDVRTRRNAVAQAERKAAQHAAPAYLYRWDWPAPGGDGRWGAVHGTDLSPSLSNPTTPMSMNTAGARLMAGRIGQAFIAFAKSGDPNNRAVPLWPPYDPERWPVMIFDTQTRVASDPDRDLRLLWNRLKPA